MTLRSPVGAFLADSGPPALSIPHGTTRGYNTFKCRCDACKHANTVYKAECYRGEHNKGQRIERARPSLLGQLLASVLQQWGSKAKCKDHDPEIWFPEASEPWSHGVKVAKRICLSCPVRKDCLETSFADKGEQYGIWGGATEQERKAHWNHSDRIGILLKLVEDQGRQWKLSEEGAA